MSYTAVQRLRRGGPPRDGPAAPGGHGERDGRSQLLLRLAGAGDMRILAVNGLAVHSLAVNGTLPLYIVSESVLYTEYGVKKCLVHFMKRLTRSPCFSRSMAVAGGATRCSSWGKVYNSSCP